MNEHLPMSRKRARSCNEVTFDQHSPTANASEVIQVSALVCDNKFKSSTKNTSITVNTALPTRPALAVFDGFFKKTTITFPNLSRLIDRKIIVRNSWLKTEKVCK